MKNLNIIKHKKQPSPKILKKNLFSHAYLQGNSLSSPQSKTSSKILTSSTQMLVSLSQTQRFKLDFLIQSYQELINSFKLERKNFLQTMKDQFQKHLFYYTQIITLAKTHQENTKVYLRSKLQDISNIFQLKISLIETKLKNARKLLFDHNLDPIFSQKKNKIKKPHSIKLIQIGKTSSYEDGLDFDEELRQIYNQKNFQVNVQFVEMEQVQQSLQNIKTQLIKDWEARESLSVSFSSISNPQLSKATFRDNFELESEDRMISSEKDEMKQRQKSGKSAYKYEYVSKETNTSTKGKVSRSSPFQKLQIQKRSCFGNQSD